MSVYSFERLEVWKDSKSLVVEIYRLSQGFPSDEKFGLTSQIRRAGISVSSNIAEGSSRNTAKDQAYFYTMAYSSLMELLSQFIIAVDLKLITENELAEVRPQIEKVSNKLNALRNSASKR